MVDLCQLINDEPEDVGWSPAKTLKKIQSFDLRSERSWKGETFSSCLKSFVLLNFVLHIQSSIPSTPATLEILASDIAKILATLAIPTPVHAVIGVSQGGATTLAFALHHPTLASRLIVCDTQATSPAANSKAWDERIEMARTKGMAALADVTLPRWFPAGSEYVEGGRREAFIYEMVAGTQTEGFVVGARALQGYDVLPGLAQSLQRKKLLLMVGERDGALPATLKTLKESLEKDGADVKYEVVPGCGHLPMVDGARAWLDIVEKFLE